MKGLRMIHTVLLPLDLSPEGDLVMRFCTGLGTLGVRRVVCAHVLDVTGLEGPVIAAKIDEVRVLLREKVQPLVDAGLDVEVRIPTGEPAREVLALAAEAHVDALVIGTWGITAADRLFVASVADDLVRDAGIPSLTLRYDLLHNAEDPAALAKRFARMLIVPTDFSATANCALDIAFGMPPASVGNIRVLHVLPTDIPENRVAKVEAGVEFQLRNIADVAREHGVHATPVIGHGDPGRAIMAEIEDAAATGLVIGSRGSSVLGEALLGSVSMMLMRQASCPVMICP
jgi:nucleotide-binding universal stress UspA family protein